MNKQKKQFIIVIVLMIICVGGYFGISHYYTQKSEKESKNASADKIVAFKLKDYTDITSISYIKDKKNITLIYDNSGKWNAANDASADIDENIVWNNILPSVASIEAVRKIEKPEDISQYGFTKTEGGKISAGTNTIVLMDSKGEAGTIYIGNQNPYDTEKYYMMIEGDDNVYSVDEKVQNAFAYSIEDLTKEETVTTLETAK